MWVLKILSLSGEMKKIKSLTTIKIRVKMRLDMKPEI